MYKNYANLFRSRDEVIPKLDFNEILKTGNITKLYPADCKSLDGPLTVEEMGKTLQK